MERIGEAVSHYIEQQRDLMLDPVSVLIVVAILLVFLILRITGHRKSIRQRIAEMEDADFPVDQAPTPVSDRRPPEAAPSARHSCPDSTDRGR